MFKRFLLICLILFILGGIAAAGVAYWGYYYITRDLPSFTRYSPATVSNLYAADGTQIAEFYQERRYLATIDEIPVMVRNCFIAAEDASFYSHSGIDYVSIFRAMVKNLESGSAKQGASTITQQVVKNLLLTSEKRIKRKLQEAILSYRIEHSLSKDQILEIYLNQIFFGNTAYGIKAAAQLYFHKTLKELTLAEAAMLAGLPKAPSRYSPLTRMDRAKRRQKYVLGQMAKIGFATEAEADEAYKQKIDIYPASSQNIFAAPYYVSEVRRILAEQWPQLNIDTDGLQIYTALDLTADKMANDALHKGLREVDKRRGWRGPLTIISGAEHEKFVEHFSNSIEETLKPGTVYPAMVSEVSAASGRARLDLGKLSGIINLKEAVWAKKRIDNQDRATWIKLEELLRPGDVIEVSLDDSSTATAGAAPKTLPPGMAPALALDQTPDIEGAVTLSDPYSGKVLTTVGGYSYQRSQFNRATQGLRQPGSSFKPIVYLAAVDGFGYTPATIVYDTPRTFRVGDEFWTPANFDEKFLGGITLRVALEKSRNLVSADLVSRIGVDAPIKYAKLMGIKSKLGRNLSLALGSSEVTLLELVRAYGVFAAKGVLFDSVFITKIVDREGKVLYDYENDRLSRARQVISEQSAFIMANMMKGVVEHGTGYRVKELGRPVAAKTGTSNDQMDTWFVGYTPHWSCGVWVGFDQKKTIGDKETGGKVAAPVWLYLMRDFLNFQDAKNYEKLVEDTKAESERLGIEYVAPEPLQPADFSVPAGVDPYWINKQSGLLAEPESAGAIYEYFVKGTEPARGAAESTSTNSYLESPDL